MTGRLFKAAEANDLGERTYRWRPVRLTGTLAAGEHVFAISLYNSDPDSSDLRIGNIALFGVPMDTAGQE